VADGDLRRSALRLIVDGAGEPAWNMAVDEALLQLGEAPVLRLYGWRPYAVSLGYFQRFADFADLAATTPIVRRLTGGGAIHHGDELTFALVVDADVLPADVATSYRLVHDAAVAALAEVGVRSRRQPGGDGPSARPKDRWCFADPGRDDVVTDRGKLLGSAQRRVAQPRPRVLHHGSLVLQAPAHTPFVAAAADQQPVDPALRERLAGRFVAHLARTLDLEPSPAALTMPERTLATTLRERRYLDPAFTQQR